jgi:hypothetical protein
VAEPLTEYYEPPLDVAAREARARAARRVEERRRQELEEEAVALAAEAAAAAARAAAAEAAAEAAAAAASESAAAGAAAAKADAGVALGCLYPEAAGSGPPEATQGLGSVSLTVFGALPPSTQAPMDVFFTQPASQLG